MRLRLLPALLALLFVPVAAAAPSQLGFTLPDEPLTMGTPIPVAVRLTVSGFVCHEPRDFVVNLAARASEGLEVTMEPTLVFTVPARSYMVEDYSAERITNVTFSGGAQEEYVHLIATFEADSVGPCFVPGRFDGSAASIGAAVFPASDKPVDPTPEPTPGPTPEPTPASPTPRATPPRPGGGMTCGPEGGCGYIGDYHSAEIGGKATPGAAPVLVVGLAALAALVARRR